MIDLHSHILPGVDDGAATLEQSVAIARAAVADGVEIMAATPHVRDDYPTTAARMEQGVAELRGALAAEGIPLDVRPGGEIALDRLDALSADERRRFGLAGNPRYLLLEFPYYGWPLALGQIVEELRAAGTTAVLAHPERSPDVAADPGRLRPAVEAVLTSGNRASSPGTPRIAWAACPSSRKSRPSVHSSSRCSSAGGSNGSRSSTAG